MTRRDDLVALRDAVRAGTADKAMFDATWPYAHNYEHHHALQASMGDLNAAKTLHEAVLPDWEYAIYSPAGGFPYFEAQLETPEMRSVYDHPICGDADNPARAWLLASLEALIAQEGAPMTPVKDRGVHD